jgi:hypothetical protein
MIDHAGATSTVNVICNPSILFEGDGDHLGLEFSAVTVVVIDVLPPWGPANANTDGTLFS